MAPFDKIIQFLDRKSVVYRVVEHAACGSAQEYHEVVGTRYRQQLKALFLRIKKEDVVSFIIAVVPGDMRSDLNKIKKYLEAQQVQMGSPEELMEHTGCVFGVVPPLGEVFGIGTIVDNHCFEENEVCFNAGRLTHSVFLSKSEFQKMIGDKVADIVKSDQN